MFGREFLSVAQIQYSYRRTPVFLCEYSSIPLGGLTQPHPSDLKTQLQKYIVRIWLAGMC